jgi:hypothetical protein
LTNFHDTTFIQSTCVWSSFPMRVSDFTDPEKKIWNTLTYFAGTTCQGSAARRVSSPG